SGASGRRITSSTTSSPCCRRIKSTDGCRHGRCMSSAAAPRAAGWPCRSGSPRMGEEERGGPSSPPKEEGTDPFFTRKGGTLKVLVTGAAGFIGFHTAKRLLERGDEVVGLDNLNEYYDVTLKRARLAQLEPMPGFKFVKLDLADREGVAQLFASERFDRVVHLGAQAGVRYSIENPFSYSESNVTGTLTILEGCRRNGIEHLVFASTSSVYGANTKMPFSVHQNVDHPLSLYAATKKANELMAHTYASLYGIPCTGLRFFTVYGPFGRPDMALFQFTRNILAGKPIDVFNYGNHRRDFTYIDDIVGGVVAALDRVAMPNPDWSGDAPDPATSSAPYRIYNIGNQQ